MKFEIIQYLQLLSSDTVPLPRLLHCQTVCDDPAGAPIANPSADNNTVADNAFIHNAYGASPFPPPFPGVFDIIYLNTPPGETGEGNCFNNNQDMDGLTSFPPPDQLPHGGCE